MDQDKGLKDKFGTKGGWAVPEGFFESVYNEIDSKLPEYKEAPQVELTMWQRLKPYVYLAAMFAGIWCTMKIFYSVSTNGELSLENPPEHIAQVMASVSENDLYSSSTTTSDYDVEEDLISSYDNFSEFEKDFGYEFDPEYESLEIGNIK